MHYPFQPTVAPGAPRKDLARLLRHHVLRAMEADWHYDQRPATITHGSLLRQSAVGNFFDVGTYLREEQGPFRRQAADGNAAYVLQNHRRLIHARWMNTLEPGDEEAWLCARHYCGLPA